MKVNSLFFISLTVLLLEICIHCCYAQERTFSIDENAGTFLKDGGPFQFISGSLYYHRIPFIYWTEQATRLNNIGISVVYSSIPWSYHCQDVSNCSFDGDRDVESFLKMLDDMKMLVVLKIGPYAEDNIQLGGLPPWLFHLNESMNIRSLDQGFVSQVTEWFSILLPKIKPFLYENGGPVIMIQIEENYGWYSGSNPEYFKLLKDQARTHLGDSVILTTADEYGAVMNEEDSLPYDGILMTYSEDWRLLKTILSPHAFNELDYIQPNKPWIFSVRVMCDYKEDTFCVENLENNTNIESLSNLYISSDRININLCITFNHINWDYWNDTSSTDIPPENRTVYEAISGFLAQTVSIHRDHVYREEYNNLSCEKLQLLEAKHLLTLETDAVTSDRPFNMEYLGQYQGFVLYSTDITHLNDTSAFDLKFSQLRGDGLVYTWSETDQYIFHGYIHEYTVSKEISMLSYSPAQTLLILLQNKGYSKQLYTRRSEAKGLGSVFFNDQELLNWWNEPLKQPYVDASDISSGLFNVTKMNTPGIIYVATIFIEDEDRLLDMFIEYDAFFMGIAYVNEKYVDTIEPTYAVNATYILYIDKTYLKLGNNTISIISLNTFDNIDQFTVCIHK